MRLRPLADPQLVYRGDYAAEEGREGKEKGEERKGKGGKRFPTSFFNQ